MAPTGVGVACDVTKAVFLDDESGVDVPDGQFLKVFSLFRAISLFQIIRMPPCPTPPACGGGQPLFLPWLTSGPSSGKPLLVISSWGPPAVGCITFYFYTHSFLGYFLVFTSGSPFRL